MFSSSGDIKMALVSLRGTRWRNLLTMLGVVIGIVSVVTVVGIGEGVKQQISQQVSQFGKDLITVRPGHVGGSSSVGQLQNADLLFGLSSISGLSEQDLQAVQNTPSVAIAAPLGVVPGAVTAAGQSVRNALVVATNPNLPGVLNQAILYGNFFTADQSQSNIAVLGQSIAQRMFGEYVPLGHEFSFRGQTFIVGGIFSGFNTTPLSPTANFNDAIFIPYQAADQITGSSLQSYAILAKPNNPNNVAQAAGDITGSLRHAHGGEQDFSVLSPSQQVSSSSQVVDLLTNLITAVAVISLIVGGVGIMNVMLVSVTERIHEIGVRKAVGATNRQILRQFLYEAMVLSVSGGALGIAVAVGTDILLRVYTSLKPVISVWAIMMSTTVSIMIGVIFGVAPALKAARKDPIEALRRE
ncbi:MAG TPA: ABC transporter permease [Candidatus Saccharimonadales bacterium]|nr:ABC transporter permease [Candidatus Saccharimonadales bacterium]